MRQRTTNSRKAFTLIELIIVIVILGILAAIAVVGYNAIINRSKDQAVKSTASSIARELHAVAAFDQGGTLKTWSAYLADDDVAADLGALGDVTASVDVDDDDTAAALVVTKGDRTACVTLPVSAGAIARPGVINAPVMGTATDGVCPS